MPCVLIDKISRGGAEARRRRHIASVAEADLGLVVELKGETEARQEVVNAARPGVAIVLVNENPRAVVGRLVALGRKYVQDLLRHRGRSRLKFRNRVGQIQPL